MSQEDYELEVSATREEAAAVLQSVTDAVLAGTVQLGEGSDAVTVALPEELTVEVEYETDEDGASLELELEWSQSDRTSSAASETATESDVEDETATRPTDEGTGESADESAPDSGESASEIGEDVVPVGTVDGVQSLARFELFRDRRDEWRWRLRHRNGNVVATSGEGYTRKHNARKGIRSVVQNASGAEVREDETN